jgi:general secretion pathway protein I
MRLTRAADANQIGRQLGNSTRGGERPSQGFSLLEVLVAMMVLGVAFSTLFGLISGSMRNVDRLQEYEKITRMAQMKLNELTMQLNQGLTPELSGTFDLKYRWQSRLEPLALEVGSQAKPGYSLFRVWLSVQWSGRDHENEFTLETITWQPHPVEAQS